MEAQTISWKIVQDNMENSQGSDRGGLNAPSTTRDQGGGRGVLR